MFAIVHGVLFAQLPYGAPDRLVGIGLQSAEQRLTQAPGLYFMYERFARHLDGVGLYKIGNANVRTSSDSADVESVATSWVTASVVPLLQVQPLLGRSFTAEEEFRGGPNAVILSESEWRERFNAATDIVGKTLIVNDAPRVIVGVMPERFAFPTAATRVWLPVKRADNDSVGDFFYSGVARLAPGATAAQAQIELAAILPRVAELYPRLQSGGSTAAWLKDVKPTPVVLPLREELTGKIAPLLWLLAAAAALVLLVVWANVANLMLVRAEAHQFEFAIRKALGASRLRVATHFLGESVVLGTIVAILALLASYGAVKAFVIFEPADIPRLDELGIGLTTASFIAVVTIVGMIICAAVPAVQIWRGHLSRNLHDGGRGQSSGKSQQRLRATITVLQIALALVVSLGSALLLRTAQRLYDIHPGFDAREVTTLRILLPFARYRDSATVAFYARLTERVAEVPSVRAAGLTMQLPLGGGGTLQQTFELGREGRTMSLPVNIIGNGYFGAMGIPILWGRDFRPLTLEQGKDIVISQSAAATLFGDTNGAATLGKLLTLASTGPTYTVVGVVGDVRNIDLTLLPSAMIYRPQVVPTDPASEPEPRPSMVLVVKSSGPPGAVLPAIRKIMFDLDPTVPISEARSMSDVVRASTARLSLSLTLMTVAAVITLLVGGIGLYGLMAYMVALRTREFGVRVALGADRRRIARLVVARGLKLTAIGVGTGLALYAFAAPFLRAYLFDVTVTDPVALAASILVIVTIAFIASWIPAKRAACIDPADALRAE